MCWPQRVHSNSCPRCSLTKAGWGFVQVQERADRDKWCPLLETEQRCGVIGSRYTVSSNHSKHCVRYRPEPRDADDSPTPIMRIVAMNTDDDVSVRFSFVVSDDAGQNEYPFLFSKAPWRGFVRAGGHRHYRPILACGVPYCSAHFPSSLIGTTLTSTGLDSAAGGTPGSRLYGAAKPALTVAALISTERLRD